MRCVWLVPVGSALALAREAVVGPRGDLLELRDADVGFRAWLEAAAPQPYTVCRCRCAAPGDGGGVACAHWPAHAARLADGAAAVYGGLPGGGGASLAAACAAAAAAAASASVPAAAAGAIATVAIAVDAGGGARALAAPAAAAAAAAAAAVVVVDGTGARRASPAVKNSAWCRERATAEVAGADEVLLAAADGALLEGLTSNFFLIDSGGDLRTAPTSAVLAGVGRARVLAAARALGISVVEEAPTPAAARAARGCFLSDAPSESQTRRDTFERLRLARIELAFRAFVGGGQPSAPRGSPTRREKRVSENSTQATPTGSAPSRRSGHRTADCSTPPTAPPSARSSPPRARARPTSSASPPRRADSGGCGAEPGAAPQPEERLRP